MMHNLQLLFRKGHGLMGRRVHECVAFRHPILQDSFLTAAQKLNFCKTKKALLPPTNDWSRGVQ